MALISSPENNKGILSRKYSFGILIKMKMAIPQGIATMGIITGQPPWILKGLSKLGCFRRRLTKTAKPIRYVGILNQVPMTKRSTNPKPKVMTLKIIP